MDCSFQVGQKVVCIRDAADLLYAGPEAAPQKDGIYTVREVLLEEDDVWLLLEEILNPPEDYVDGYGEPCWHHEGFRPVIERETDISIFTAMLTNQKAKVDA